MHKQFVRITFLLLSPFIWAQEAFLPSDLRQHNQTQFNSSLLNVAYGLDWNNPDALSVWSRWQWQTIDADPTTVFAHYTHGIHEKSSLDIGFLQHNTGNYLQTGANLGYAHAFLLSDEVKLILGTNVFGFQQQWANDESDPDNPLSTGDNFIVTISPAARLVVSGFDMGFAVENALDFNLSGDDQNEAMKMQSYIGSLGYEVPLNIFEGWGQSTLRPMVYLKSVVDLHTQFGVNALFSTPKFWVQGGFNNYYGPSGGAGVTFANKFSVGGLLEVGTEWPQSNEDPTCEIVASYHIGKTKEREKTVEIDEEKDDEMVLDQTQVEEASEKHDVQEDSEAQLLEAEKQRLAKQAQVRDSIARAEQRAKELLDAQRKKDSIAKLQKQKVDVRPNEKYQEVSEADGLEPGFYLIANVFGTKRYFEDFMQTLRKKGLEPKSFYRSQNKFNYVYLGRYNSMQEARSARDSNFFGKYAEKTWIFRVRRE